MEASDEAMFRTISQGVPGTEMPANVFEDSETWALVAYLRSLNAGTRTPIVGDRAKGEQLFLVKSGCAQCHMVKGRGRQAGTGADTGRQCAIGGVPDGVHTRAGQRAQPGNDGPKQPLRDTAGVRNGNGSYLGGDRIVGVAKNEDAFSLQLFGQDEKLHLLLKKDLREVVHERRSLMPTYTEVMLSSDELHDLLAYLTSLRGEEK